MTYTGDAAAEPLLCRVCHQPLQPQYYFCPNCGTKVQAVPLSITTNSQIALYAFSIILPWIAFIMITRWQGITYLRSNNAKTRQVGMIATALLLLSTIFTFYLAYVTLVNMVNQSLASVNADMNF